jgi:hypothetical protein
MAAAAKRNRFISRRSAAALVASIMTIGCAPLPPPRSAENTPDEMLQPPTDIEILLDESLPPPTGFELEPDEALPQPTRIELEPDETLLISQITWSDFLAYVKLLESVKPGAYVISQTGLGGGYAVCAEVHQCYNTEYYVRHALRLCEAEGEKCVVFAKDSAIVVSFEIVD